MNARTWAAVITWRQLRLSTANNTNADTANKDKYFTADIQATFIQTYTYTCTHVIPTPAAGGKEASMGAGAGAT